MNIKTEEKRKRSNNKSFDEMIEEEQQKLQEQDEALDNLNKQIKSTFSPGKWK